MTVQSASSIDVLMSLDPLEMSNQDLDAIIAYQRKAKANFDLGIKPKKGANAEGKTIDLSQVISNITGAQPKVQGKVDRRF